MTDTILDPDMGIATPVTLPEEQASSEVTQSSTGKKNMENSDTRPPELTTVAREVDDEWSLPTSATDVVLPIPTAENGCIPRSEVAFNTSEPFATGSFGRVYRGTWRKTDVVVKCVDITSETDRQAFLREVQVWRSARHPNIIPFFGACHVGSPCFIVCDFAANGFLGDYLYRQQQSGAAPMWQKLHEVALGLYFLHKSGIVHGDLKGNNILVAKDGTAMLADFGLSFISSKPQPQVKALGAIRWRAPEYVIQGGAGPSFEADVYSLGMCIVEAVTGQPPWDSLPDVAVAMHLRRKRMLKRPPGMSDEAWSLVERMCVYEPSERMKLEDVVDVLERFAHNERYQQFSAAWAEQLNTTEPESELPSRNVEAGIHVFYRTGWSTPHIHYTTGSGWTQVPGLAMTASTDTMSFPSARGWFEFHLPSPVNRLEFVLNSGDAGEVWDNNFSKNYHVRTGTWQLTSPLAVRAKPDDGSGLHIFFQTGWAAPNLHYSTGSGWTQVPGVVMAPSKDASYPSALGWFEYHFLPPTSWIEFVLNDGGGAWDNHNDTNYNATSAGTWVVMSSVCTPSNVPDTSEEAALV